MAIVLVPFVVVAVFAFLLSGTKTSFEPLRTLVVDPALLVVTFSLLDCVARRFEDGETGRLRTRLLHLLAAVIYMGVITGTYGGSDWRMYDSYGTEYVEQFRRFDLSSPSDVRTQFIWVLTGTVYTVTGPSRLPGTLVFSWFSFWGLYLFWRTFTIAVPGRERLRPTLIALRMPSLVFGGQRSARTPGRCPR